MSSAEFTPNTVNGIPNLKAVLNDSWAIDDERIEVTATRESVFIEFAEEGVTSAFTGLRGFKPDDLDTLIDTLVAAKALTLALASEAAEVANA
jgi:hypothetical protein